MQFSKKKRLLVVILIFSIVVLSQLVFSKDIFFDGFESGNLTGWILTNTAGASNWTISSEDPYIGIYHIEAKPRENTEPASIIKKTISTFDYDNISISYHRRLINLDNHDEFKSYWYNGFSWLLLEETDSTSEDDDVYLFKSFNLNNNASNNADFQIKFECTANSNNEYCRIDDVNISGIPITTTSTTSSSSSTTTSSTTTTLPLETTTSSTSSTTELTTTTTLQLTTTTTSSTTSSTTVDNTLNIELISPLDNATYTTSNDLTFQYNITSINNISNCSLMINNTLDQTNTNISTNQVQIFTKTLPNSDYLWFVTCTDYNSYTKNSTIFALIVNYIQPNNPAPSTGGDGGGGGNRLTNPPAPTETSTRETTPILIPAPAPELKKQEQAQEEPKQVEQIKKSSMFDKLKNIISLTGKAISEKSNAFSSTNLIPLVLLGLLILFGLLFKKKERIKDKLFFLHSDLYGRNSYFFPFLVFKFFTV